MPWEICQTPINKLAVEQYAQEQCHGKSPQTPISKLTVEQIFYASSAFYHYKQILSNESMRQTFEIF
jgi:hypothetical protein